MMTSRKALDLTRTDTALFNYDAAISLWEDKSDTMTDNECLALLEELDTLIAAVGEAFAQDTADRNPRDTARRVRPGPWLRKLVSDFRESK